MLHAISLQEDHYQRGTHCKIAQFINMFIRNIKTMRVFPAPGTTCHKTNWFLDLLFEEAIRSEIVSDVWLRLIAPASLREISCTEWPAYNAIAASMIVGVGQYLPSSHLLEFIALPLTRFNTPVRARWVLQYYILRGIEVCRYVVLVQ